MEFVLIIYSITNFYMHIPDLIPQFRRYALMERGMQLKSTKAIITSVQLLIKETNISALNRLGTQQIRNFLYNQKEKRGWSNKTFRNHRQYLKIFFDYTYRFGWISKNPVNKIEKPRLTKPLPRSLSTNQVDAVLFHLDGSKWVSYLETVRNKAIIRTFLYTGIRLNELLTLKTQDVNLEQYEIKIVNGKGGKDRIVPIHPKLYPYLNIYRAENQKLNTKYFFTSLRSDKPLTQKNLYVVIEKLRKKSNIYFTPHMLRHTMAKMSIEANLNPFLLQSILGHADISTTQIYVSASAKAVKENFQKLNFV